MARGESRAGDRLHALEGADIADERIGFQCDDLIVVADPVSIGIREIGTRRVEVFIIIAQAIPIEVPGVAVGRVERDGGGMAVAGGEVPAVGLRLVGLVVIVELIVFAVILAFTSWFLQPPRPAELGRLYVGTLMLLCSLLVTVAIVILALPLSKYRSLRPEQLAGKVVIDVMNYWAPTDGTILEFEGEASSSEVVQRHLAGARLVEAILGDQHKIWPLSSVLTDYRGVSGVAFSVPSLVGPAGPIFLDAECAWYGDPAFDLAFCLNHLLLKCLWTPAARADFLAAFDALAKSYLAGIDFEDAAALEARAARLLPGLFLARVDGKSPVEYLNSDAERDRVRRVASALLLEPAAHLAGVRAAWQKELQA